MKKWVIALIIGVIGASIATYFAYTQATNTSKIITKDGIKAQVYSCTKGDDNYFHIVLLFKASPNEVKMYPAHEGNWNGMMWGGEVIIMRDGKQWSEGKITFNNREGLWEATAPFSFPLIADPNYNCELGVWTLIIKPAG